MNDETTSLECVNCGSRVGKSVINVEGPHVYHVEEDFPLTVALNAAPTCPVCNEPITVECEKIREVLRQLHAPFLPDDTELEPVEPCRHE